jgi:hypothetical protein
MTWYMSYGVTATLQPLRLWGRFSYQANLLHIPKTLPNFKENDYKNRPLALVYNRSVPVTIMSPLKWLNYSIVDYTINFIEKTCLLILITHHFW